MLSAVPQDHTTDPLVRVSKRAMASSLAWRLHYGTVAATIVVFAAYLFACLDAHRQSPAERADALVQEMREFPAALPATVRSDGSTDPVEQRRERVYAELLVIGVDALPSLSRALSDPDVRIRRSAALFLDTAGSTWYHTSLPVMRPKSATLTAHELELMKIIWRRDEPVTVRDVYEELRRHRTVAYTTVLTNMVGDLQRIREYPARGFQIPQEIPADVWDAYEQLVGAGYNRHLMKD